MPNDKINAGRLRQALDLLRELLAGHPGEGGGEGEQAGGGRRPAAQAQAHTEAHTEAQAGESEETDNMADNEGAIEALRAENAELREQLAHFADRVKVLERIVTDRSVNVAAQIEALRDSEKREQN